MIYRPENVLFMGIGLYVLIYLFSPLEVLVEMEFGSFVFIGLSIAALGQPGGGLFSPGRDNPADPFRTTDADRKPVVLDHDLPRGAGQPAAACGQVCVAWRG
jgi:hypothetical protein